ncbi:phosphatase PAP2 family protein [Herbaspirillum sp. HC18]|nr:phosphatase PAP2 family protein [Herbaspirillum sp. HC18]
MNLFLRRYGDVVLLCALALVFVLWPELDLMIAAQFYEPGIGFPMNELWWVQLTYRVLAHVWVLAAIGMFLLVLGFLPGFKAHLAPRRKAIAYLLAVLLAGPGLVVNTVLKDHWGRARPIHLEQFGGKAQFTPPLQPSTQCGRNCSFASGHAAGAFFPMAFFWVTRRRRWLVGGIALGLFVGYVRMAMGAHFLSDVLFAGMIVHFACRGFAWLFRLPPVGAAPGIRLKPGYS